MSSKPRPAPDNRRKPLLSSQQDLEPSQLVAGSMLCLLLRRLLSAARFISLVMLPSQIKTDTDVIQIPATR